MTPLSWTAIQYKGVTMTDFNAFMKEYGPPTEVEKADKMLLDQYKSVVPDQMIEFWEFFGFARYANGLLWVVNPNQLDDVLTEWLPRKTRPPHAVPIIRTAFGNVIYWDKDEFRLLDIN